MANWTVFSGNGVCGVCLRPVEYCAGVYQVPNEAFYSSIKYREGISGQAADFGMTVDQYIATIRTTDVTAHTAVCDQCIGMFEAGPAVYGGIAQQNHTQPVAVQNVVYTPPNVPVNAVPVGGVPQQQGGISPLQGPATPLIPATGEANADGAVKKSLRRFLKGWVIAMIVVTSCAAVSVMQLLSNDDFGLALLTLAFIGCSIIGYVRTLGKRASGCWIALLGSILLLFMNGVQIGNHIVVVTFGLPLCIATFYITMKQIDYRFWKYMKLPQPQAQATPPAPLPAAVPPVVQAPREPPKPRPKAAKASTPNSSVI